MSQWRIRVYRYSPYLTFVDDMASENIELLYGLVHTIRKLRKKGMDIRNRVWQNWIEDCIDELVEQENME